MNQSYYIFFNISSLTGLQHGSHLLYHTDIQLLTIPGGSKLPKLLVYQLRKTASDMDNYKT